VGDDDQPRGAALLVVPKPLLSDFVTTAESVLFCATVGENYASVDRIIQKGACTHDELLRDVREMVLTQRNNFMSETTL
jgi:hypothetical protein